MCRFTESMNPQNPPLSLKLEPSPGSDIMDCYDHAVDIVRRLGVVVTFEFNEVHCGVRPCDAADVEAKPRFHHNYHHELAKTTGCKICYAN